MDASECTAAVLYAAKSTRDERGSIPTQLADCRRLAEREGWRVVAEHSDEAASAYKSSRGDGLARAKADAERLARTGRGCVLVVQHTDRLARGDGVAADHLVELALWARRAGVRIASVQDPTTCEGGLAFAAMMGDRNYEDSRRKALAVKAGMGRRRTKGMHMGGPRKFGYEYVRDEYGRTVPDQPLRPHPTERHVVGRIYGDYAAGVSQQGIQRALNAEGVPTATGSDWHQGTIAKILADPFYAGLVRDGDDVVPGRHEAIVDLDLWERVAAMRREGRRTLGRAGGRPARNGFLFVNGHLRCGRCGAAMVPRTARRKAPNGGYRGKVYESYRCLTRIRNVSACDQRALPRAAVDAAALAALTERGISVERTRAQMAEAMRRSHDEARARLTAALTTEQRMAERLRRVKRDYVDGALPVEDWLELRPELEADAAAATAQRQQAERHAASLDATDAEVTDGALGALGGVHDAIAAFLADASHLDEVRLRLRQVYERFIVEDDGDTVALVPEIRPDALDAVMADISAARRESLRATTHSEGLQT